MKPYEWISLVGLFVGPIVAVAISLWSQARQARRARQNAIVVTLLNNQHDFSAADYSAAIRLLPIEFYKSKSVIALWKDYMVSVNFVPTPENQEAHHREFLDRKNALIIAVAKVVGLNLKEVDLRNMVYVAKAHSDQLALEANAKRAIVRIADSLEKANNAQTH